MKATMGLIPHAAADLFPMMSADDFAALKDDIAKHGVRHPVVLHEGRIIDGRNRDRACRELGIETPTEDWTGSGSVVAYVWSVNGPRRHMTKSALAAVATEMLPMLEAEAAVRKDEGGRSGGRGHKKTIGNDLPKVSPDDGKAVSQAAKIVGVNRQYVQDAKKLKNDAPDLFDEVKSGVATVPEAKRRLDKRIEPATKAPSEAVERAAFNDFLSRCITKIRKMLDECPEIYRPVLREHLVAIGEEVI